MAADVSAVMDTLGIERAVFAGWSDGACTALVLGDRAPARVAGVFFFACNMDPSGVQAITEFPPIVGRCFSRHVLDYRQLSPTPGDFEGFAKAVETMQKTQPNYSAADLSRIAVPVTVALGEHDEFIKRDHAEYLARTIPSAEFVLLEGVSHFAPLQRPAQFNAALLAFLSREDLLWRR
jgi:pimeloyl-ACP methyl ester carboxylesterase